VVQELSLQWAVHEEVWLLSYKRCKLINSSHTVFNFRIRTAGIARIASIENANNIRKGEKTEIRVRHAI